MTTAWFLVPYVVDPLDPHTRRCALDDDAGATYAAAECMGDQAVCRVDADQSVIDDLTLKYALITTDLGAVIPADARQSLRDIGLAAGYTESQVQGVEMSVTTYAEWMAAMLTYRRKPRWNGTQVVVDGAVVPAGSLPV